MSGRVYLSPPHMSGRELDMVRDAVESNWVAPVGPHVDAFEAEFAGIVGARHAVAVSTGTAAIHLALRILGIGAGDEVWVSSLTFCASVNPILYVGASPVFVDSERESWNMDPRLLTDALDRRAVDGRLPRALILVHLYGQCADIDPIASACLRHGVPLIEDAAEALGATYRGRAPGTFGIVGTFSFNGNKIITTSGGGMLVTDDAVLANHAGKLATQARDPAPHYEHSEIGYNYRLSNLLAGVGRAQLAVLEERVLARRRNFQRYARGLGDLPGLEFMPEAPWGRHSRWLTTLTVDPERFGADRERIRLALEAEDIEARPVWKPMHLQPAYASRAAIGGDVAAALFRDGLCLPSGSNLRDEDLDRIVEVVRQVHREAVHPGGS